VNRQVAKRAAKARRQRQTRAGIGAFLALAIVVLGTVWLLGGFDKKPKNSNQASGASCLWVPGEANANAKDVGTPPQTATAKGPETVKITTNLGDVVLTSMGDKAPCSVTSLDYLIGKKFYDGTKCHRLTTEGSFVLQCGDPTGTGQGGPTYKFADENLPTPANPSASPSASAPASPSPAPSASASTALYPAGTVAMANSGPNTNGSQFFLVYKDSNFDGPKYSVIGKISQGLDVLQKIAAEGAVDDKGAKAAEGKPKTEVTIQTVTVTPLVPPVS